MHCYNQSQWKYLEFLHTYICAYLFRGERDWAGQGKGQRRSPALRPRIPADNSTSVLRSQFWHHQFFWIFLGILHLSPNCPHKVLIQVFLPGTYGCLHWRNPDINSILIHTFSVNFNFPSALTPWENVWLQLPLIQLLLWYKDIHEMRGLWTLRHINRALSIGIKLSRMGNTSPIVLQSMRRGCIFDGEGNLPASFRWRPRWIAKPGIQTFEIWEGEDFQ